MSGCHGLQAWPHPAVEHRQRGQGHRVAHLPHEWLLIKVLHAFTIFSLAPIRRLIPRQTGLVRKPPKSQFGWTVALNSSHLHYGNSTFPGNTDALPQKHLNSVGDSSNVQQTVVGEETGIMGPQTENDLTVCNPRELSLFYLKEKRTCRTGSPDKGKPARESPSKPSGVLGRKAVRGKWHESQHPFR